MADYSRMDEALDRLTPYGPDLRNGLTNHAPMACEALAAMDRADAVLPWLERYRPSLAPRPVARERIGAVDWRAALGRPERATDWDYFFQAELAEAPWREVLARWTVRLAPGFCSSATHGVIRVGHAARSLEQSASELRIRELADGLASWAAYYQTLPGTPAGGVVGLSAPTAIGRVPFIPAENSRFTGTIDSAMAALEELPEFRQVIHLLDVERDPGAVVSDHTEVFARVFLTNARDSLSAIVFTHAVTSAAGLRMLLPYLAEKQRREALSYAWQAACALYSAFGKAPAASGEVESPVEDRGTLIDMAVANGDEHAIKLTEACLREYEIHASPAYLAAARKGIDLLTAG